MLGASRERKGPSGPTKGHTQPGSVTPTPRAPSGSPVGCRPQQLLMVCPRTLPTLEGARLRWGAHGRWSVCSEGPHAMLGPKVPGSGVGRRSRGCGA